MDKATEQHLIKWMEHEFYPCDRDDEEFQQCLVAMERIVAEDPDFWMERGWRDVYSELQNRITTVALSLGT